MSKLHKAGSKHEIAYQELCAILKKLADEHSLSSTELLAIASNMVGKMIAMQDQRKYTSSQIMDMVARNVELGNQQAIAELMNKTAGNS